MAESGSVSNEAFVTLATNDTYSLGASVLANSLRRVGTTRKLAIMITPGVSQGMRESLSTVFDVVTQVDVLDSQDSANLTLLTRPDLGVTFTKLHCWRLTQFTKCVFLDADTLVLQNCDELFEREEFSAAPDPGWPDCFNSGVFVFRPSEETYTRLMEFAASTGSFDGGDQGLLNLYYSGWATKEIEKHLPFIYNVVSQSFYSYLPAFKQYGKNVKIVHFIGALKPWHAAFNTATGQVESHAQTYHHQEYLQIWWGIFMDKVNPALDPEVTGERQTNLVRLVHGPPQNLHIPANGAPLPATNQHSVPSHMASPYQPPDFPVFYDPALCPPGEHGEKQTSPVLIEMPSCDRRYGHFESFSSEPPMTGTEDYPNLEQVYLCQQQHHAIEGYCDGFDSENVMKPDVEDDSVSHMQSTEHSNSLVDNGDGVNTNDHPTIEHSNSTDDQSETGARSHDQDLPHVDISSNNSRVCVVQSAEEVGSCGAIQDTLTDQLEDNTLMGLVGELSSLRLDSSVPYTPEQLQDRQRQYAWERGQVDYLGMDSFQHIQKHIDDVVTGKVEVQKEESAEKSEKDPPKKSSQSDTKKKGKK